MTIRVQHVLVLISILTPTIACTQEPPEHDPCDVNPNLITCQETGEDETGGGETGEGPGAGLCAPLKPGVDGESYECHGSGNGWLDLDIHPVGAQDPKCLNWGDQAPPKHPTSKDCVPIDITSLPNGVPAPGACCSDEALPEDITYQCAEDCARAACKLAITKLRDAALSLSTKGPEGVVRLDLFYLANLLESPDRFKICAQQVAKANGESTAIELGAGASPSLDFGHVKSATLHLQCALDNQTPYVLVGDACDTTPNMPPPEPESSMGGLAAVGGVSITGPMGNLSASLHDISFVFTETPDAMGLVEFRLEQFEAHASTVSVGSFAFIDPSVRLVAPANGQLGGEMISFPPGSLRMEVSAAIAVEGQLLFDGEPVSGKYVNTQWATATRSVDNEFAFIEATFETGGYSRMLMVRGSRDANDPQVWRFSLVRACANRHAIVAARGGVVAAAQHESRKLAPRDRGRAESTCDTKYVVIRRRFTSSRRASAYGHVQARAKRLHPAARSAAGPSAPPPNPAAGPRPVRRARPAMEIPVTAMEIPVMVTATGQSWTFSARKTAP